MRTFWDIAPCSLGVEGRFRDAYCLRQRDVPYKISVYTETTWHYIPKGYHLHIRCSKNLKSQQCHSLTSVTVKECEGICHVLLLGLFSHLLCHPPIWTLHVFGVISPMRDTHSLFVTLSPLRHPSGSNWRQVISSCHQNYHWILECIMHGP
jgi:hypothetical protein